MASEYDPLLGWSAPEPGDDDLAEVRGLFERAGRPYLSSPWSWAAWAIVLPAAALATPAVLASFATPGVLMLWSVVILLGGGIEVSLIRRGQAGAANSTLAGWSLRAQGNMSLVAVVVTGALLVFSAELARLIPGIWLLLLGHSFFVLGGLASKPLRRCGLLYQTGGLAALWPEFDALAIFALTTGVGNLWMAVAVWRARRSGQADVRPR